MDTADAAHLVREPRGSPLFRGWGAWRSHAFRPFTLLRRGSHQPLAEHAGVEKRGDRQAGLHQPWRPPLRRSPGPGCRCVRRGVRSGHEAHSVPCSLDPQPHRLRALPADAGTELHSAADRLRLEPSGSNPARFERGLHGRRSGAPRGRPGDCRLRSPRGLPMGGRRRGHRQGRHGGDRCGEERPLLRLPGVPRDGDRGDAPGPVGVQLRRPH